MANLIAKSLRVIDSIRSTIYFVLGRFSVVLVCLLYVRIVLTTN